MKLNKDLCELIVELEYIVGSECYNPNSYDGWNDVEGCSFRYPINVPNSERKYEKTRSNINIIYKVTVKSTTVLLSTLRMCENISKNEVCDCSPLYSNGYNRLQSNTITGVESWQKDYKSSRKTKISQNGHGRLRSAAIAD